MSRHGFAFVAVEGKSHYRIFTKGAARQPEKHGAGQNGAAFYLAFFAFINFVANFKIFAKLV
ncbi:hypothetical protein [Kingella sp. (in: b-proteobacteria)]|uniref:hypothetical protein n=1 Tax=Kingella sp. (in: b-proteobacteria) TaxID=2020713 RepID=UPI0026DD63CD|nr:hypothetical protein [Kingella sp. (in: b-proteobacteria)]MDO4656411.1 hypothetical protein [Kingella sp. (in: b-proteobacteria)]